MKRKLLSLAAALLCAVGIWADDVINITSTRLTNANLSSLTGWTFDDSFSAEGNDYTAHKTDGDANVIEFYSEWAENPGAMASSKNFKIAQTISLTAGTYRLEAYGFYREKWGDGTNTKAYLKAGSNQQYLTGLSASGVTSYSGGNDLYKAANAFSLGDFSNTLEFTLVSKQDIEVGIVGTFNTQCSWCIVGPMSLYKVLEDGTEITEVIVNPSFETGNKTGWIDETTGAGADIENKDKMYVQSNNDLAGKDGTYYAERWWYDSTIDIYQTIPNLPEGYYTITALAKAETATPTDNNIVLYAKAGSSDEVTTHVSGADDYSVEVYLNSTGDIKLGLKGSHVTQTHVAVDNFRLTYLGNPYPALEGAIAVASGKTLGFDKDEFTPYNNVGALEALAAATTINAARTASYSVVNGATSALTDATWTPNATEENAFYDGDFSECAEDNTSPLDYTPAGWTASENMRLMLKNSETYPGLTDASATSAMMSWTAGINYGETTGYTMPLNAYTIYELKFKAAGWNNESRSGMTVSVLNSSDGLAATDLGTPDRDIIGNETNTAGMTSYTKRFKTGAAGNYVFHIQSGNNFVLTDLELKKAATTTIDTDENYTPEAGLANVEMTRTIKVGYNTVCLPFDVTADQVTAAFGADSEVFNYSGDSESEGSINLTFTRNNERTISANVPVLVKVIEGQESTTQTFNGVEIKVGGATAPLFTNIYYMGVYSLTELAAGDYFLATQGGEQKIFKSQGLDGKKDTVKPFRAYFKVIDPGSGGGDVKLFIDDEATGIDSLTPDPSPVGEGSIYNLAGQRLNKMQKGINIVKQGSAKANGKKILY